MRCAAATSPEPCCEPRFDRLVLGVGFLDVDGQEPRAIAALPLHLLHAPDRAPEAGQL